LKRTLVFFVVYLIMYSYAIRKTIPEAKETA